MSSHFSQVKDDEQSHACVIRRRSERKRKKFHIYLHISKLTNDALSFIHSFFLSSSSAAAAAAHKGPTIGMVNSLKTALDVFGGQEEQSVQVLLNVDSGANLTKILTDNEGLLSSAAQLLAPSPGGLEVREVDPSSRNVTHSPDSPPSVFMEWCQSASCMSGDGDLCATLDADLASARSPSGAPIIPLPRTFCDAVAKLNNHQCLCDSDLADANKSGEAASIVKSASMIGALCKVQMITPSSGKCGL